MQLTSISHLIVISLPSPSNSQKIRRYFAFELHLSLKVRLSELLHCVFTVWALWPETTPCLPCVLTKAEQLFSPVSEAVKLPVHFPRHSPLREPRSPSRGLARDWHWLVPPRPNRCNLDFIIAYFLRSRTVWYCSDCSSLLAPLGHVPSSSWIIVSLGEIPWGLLCWHTDSNRWFLISHCNHFFFHHVEMYLLKWLLKSNNYCMRWIVL